jgi:hypothetical protein
MNDVIATTLQEISNAKQEYERLMQQAVEPVLKAIAESGQVSHLVVIGFLPGFNDGEPCEHTVNSYVNIQEMISEELFDRGISVLNEVFDEDFIEKMDDVGYIPTYRELNEEEKTFLQTAEQICEEKGALFERCSDKAILNAIDAIIVPYLDSVHQTNYQVAFVFNKDGTYKKFVDDYDCGY